MSIGGSRGKVSASRGRGTSSNKQSGTVLNFSLKLSSLFGKCLRFWFSQRYKDAGDLTVDGIHDQWKKEGQNEAGWRENESQGGQGGIMSKIYFFNIKFTKYEKNESKLIALLY